MRRANPPLRTNPESRANSISIIINQILNQYRLSHTTKNTIEAVDLRCMAAGVQIATFLPVFQNLAAVLTMKFTTLGFIVVSSGTAAITITDIAHGRHNPDTGNSALCGAARFTRSTIDRLPSAEKSSPQEETSAL